MDTRTVLHFSDQGPVGFAAIHLRTCSAVNGEFLDSAVLQALRQIDNEIGRAYPRPLPEGKGGKPKRIITRDEIFLIPSEAGFCCYRCVHRIDDGFGDLQHLRYVFEQSSSGSFSGHFLHRAAEINIDKVGFGRLYDTCRISHRFGFPSVYLNGYRSLRIVNRQFACRRSDIAHQGIGVHKLRINTIRSVAFAEHAEGWIGNILHGSEI